MNHKENNNRLQKIKFELEMMHLIDLCGYSQKLASEIDELKSRLFLSDADAEKLWFKKRILKMVKTSISSRQMMLF